MAANWGLLPSDVLQVISEKLTSIACLVRFRAVCTAWRSFSTPDSLHLPPQLPWLLLPRRYGSNLEGPEFDTCLSLYDLSQSKTHLLDLPEIQGKRICGSSHGWLVLEKKMEVWLLNPITRDQICLPSLSSQPRPFPEHDSEDEGDPEPPRKIWRYRVSIRKAILSSNPRLDPGCLVMAVFQSCWDAAYCRVGDECWTILDLKGGLHVVDLGYCNGLLYLIQRLGHVWICDVDNVTLTWIDSNIGIISEENVVFIRVIEGDCNGHGLIIVAQDSASGYNDYSVDASHLLMLSNEQEKWLPVEKEHMGADTVFVGLDFSCLPFYKLPLDFWKENCMCYSSPQLKERIDGCPNPYSYYIKLIRPSNSTVASLVGHFGQFVLDESRWYSPEKVFWLTPTLC